MHDDIVLNLQGREPVGLGVPGRGSCTRIDGLHVEANREQLGTVHSRTFRLFKLMWQSSIIGTVCGVYCFCGVGGKVGGRVGGGEGWLP